MPVEWKGLDETVTWLRHVPERFAQLAVSAAADAAHKSISDWADRHRKTGAMQRSVESRVDGVRATVWFGGDAAPYARFVAFGAKPHTITPKRKKALRWVEGDGFRFSALVRHPGYRGDNPVPEAFAAAVQAAQAVIEGGEI